MAFVVGLGICGYGLGLEFRGFKVYGFYLKIAH